MPPAPGKDPSGNAAVPASPAAQASPGPAAALTVVAGHPSTEEIAAIVAVLAARAAAAQPAAPPPAIRSPWSSRARLMREPLARGPGAWRASGLPR